jgi:hypothetical protein
LRQWSLALQMYVDGNGQKYPRLLSVASWSPLNAVTWQEEPYSIPWTERKFHCPGYKSSIGPTNWGTEYGWPSSYSYNDAGTFCWYFSGVDLGLGLGHSRDGGCVKESAIMAPSQMIAIGDDRLCYSPGDGPGAQGTGLRQLICGDFSGNFPYPKRHGKNYNLTCCDGHVEAMDPAKLFNPTNTAPRWNSDRQPHPESW